MVIDIAPGTHLRMSSNGAKARLSLVLENAYGKMVGVTARHFLDSCEEPTVYSLDGHPIGERYQTVGTVNEVTGGDPRSFHEAIGVFHLFDHVKVSRNPSAYVHDPDDLVGEPVSLALTPDPDGSGRVIGYGGALRLRLSPGEPDAIYRMPLIVGLDIHDLSILAGGSGTLLIDRAGLAAGVLISANGDRLYAAPLAPFIEKHGFSIPESPRPAAITIATLGEGGAREAWALRSVMTALRNDLAAQPSYHDDPQGENMPAELEPLLDDA